MATNFTSKQDLKDYVLRKLGAPVLDIELADEHLEDAINDTLDLFREYHYDSTGLKFKVVDFVQGQREYVLTDDVYSIVDMYVNSLDILSDSEFDEDGFLIKSSFFVGNSGLGLDYSATDLTVQRTKYELYRSEIRQPKRFDYDFLTKTLRLLFDPEKDESVAILVHSFLPEDTIYISRWFRLMVVAMCGIRWANNIGKYRDVKLVGGASYNFDDIYNQYKEEKDKLLEDLDNRYQEPLGIYVG